MITRFKEFTKKGLMSVFKLVNHQKLALSEVEGFSLRAEIEKYQAKKREERRLRRLEAIKTRQKVNRRFRRYGMAVRTR